MSEIIRFQFISPVIIGGSNSRTLDQPPIVRAPQIRGQLRFWMRALAGGTYDWRDKNKRPEYLLQIHQLESELFGDNETGQKLILYSPDPKTLKTEMKKLLPHRNKNYIERHINRYDIKKQLNSRKYNRDIEKLAKDLQSETEMILPDSNEITLRFSIRRIKPEYIERLKAVFWTWLHLGAIGRRSRRGFGSLQWLPKSGDFLDGFVDFQPEKDLTSSESLTAYLIRGMEKVKRVWGAPHLRSVPRQTYPFFCLQTIDQIFIGTIFQDDEGNPLETIEDDVGGIIHKMHGISRNGEEDEWELGHRRLSGKKRQASPMMWRIYRVSSEFVPLMVWSPLKKVQIDPNSKVYRYLNGTLGFSSPLMPSGTPVG